MSRKKKKRKGRENEVSRTRRRRNVRVIGTKVKCEVSTILESYHVYG